MALVVCRFCRFLGYVSRLVRLVRSVCSVFDCVWMPVRYAPQHFRILNANRNGWLASCRPPTWFCSFVRSARCARIQTHGRSTRRSRAQSRARVLRSERRKGVVLWWSVDRWRGSGLDARACCALRSLASCVAVRVRVVCVPALNGRGDIIIVREYQTENANAHARSMRAFGAYYMRAVYSVALSMSARVRVNYTLRSAQCAHLCALCLVVA